MSRDELAGARPAPPARASAPPRAVTEAPEPARVTAGTPGLKRAATGGVLALIAVLLAASAVRGPFTAVGPLLPLISTEFGLSTTGAAILAAIPILCFGLLAPLVPRLTDRVGLRRAALIGLAVLGAGVLLRAAGLPGLFAGTIVVGVGITVINVLLPAVTKAEFPRRMAIVTGLSATVMTLSASIGAGFALPLATATGGPSGSLLLWALPVGAALGVWLPMARRQAPAEPVPQAGTTVLRSMLRDPVALGVTFFFGLLTLSFYTTFTWLPTILHEDAGLSLSTAAGLVAIASALGGSTSLLVPWLAGRSASQVGWVLAVAMPTSVGLLGLIIAPAAAPVLWCLLVGLGNGWAFPLAIMLIMLRTRGSEQTARLSATSQFLGYLLASTGPLAAGALFDLTSSWTPAVVGLLLVLIGQTVAGWVAGRPRLVAVP